MPEIDNTKDYASFSERITLVTVGGFLCPTPQGDINEDNREEWRID